MTEIKIGGRTIPLTYTTYEMVAIQKEIGCTAYQLREEVFGLRQEEEDNPESVVMDVVTDPEKAEKLGRLISILGNAGLEESGQEGDLTGKWVLRHMKPCLIAAYAVAALAVIVEGNTPPESPAKENKGPVDEGLEEENAKKQPGN